MKKLFSLLTVTSLAASAASSVAACDAVDEIYEQQDGSEKPVTPPSDEDINIWNEQRNSLKSDINKMFSQALTAANNSSKFKPTKEGQSHNTFFSIENNRAFLDKQKTALTWAEFIKDYANEKKEIEKEINQILEEGKLIEELNKKMNDPLYYGAIKPRDGKKFFDNTNGKGNFFTIDAPNNGDNFLEQPVATNSVGLYIFKFSISINSASGVSPFTIADSKGDGNISLFESKEPPSDAIEFWLSNDEELMENVLKLNTQLINDLTAKADDHFTPLMIGTSIKNQKPDGHPDKDYIFFGDNIRSIFSKKDTDPENQDAYTAEEVSNTAFFDDSSPDVDSNYEQFKKQAAKTAKDLQFEITDMKQTNFDFLSASSDSLSQTHEITKRTSTDLRGTKTINKYLMEGTDTSSLNYFYDWFFAGGVWNPFIPGWPTVIKDDLKRWEYLRDELNRKGNSIKGRGMQLEMDDNFRVWPNSWDRFKLDHKEIFDKSNVGTSPILNDDFVRKYAYHIGFFKVSKVKAKYKNEELTLPPLSLPYALYATSKVWRPKPAEEIWPNYEHLVDNKDIVYMALDNYFAELRRFVNIQENYHEDKTLMLLGAKNGDPKAQTVKNMIKYSDEKTTKYNTKDGKYYNPYYEYNDFDYDKNPNNPNTRHIYYNGETVNNEGWLSDKSVLVTSEDKEQRKNIDKIANLKNAEFYLSTNFIHWDSYEMSQQYGYAYYSYGGHDLESITDNFTFTNRIIGNIKLHFKRTMDKRGRKLPSGVQYGKDIKKLPFIILFNDKIDKNGNIF